MTVKKKIVKKVKCRCKKKKGCRSCNGTGTFTESHYYFIDEKNKIAFDGDTLK